MPPFPMSAIVCPKATYRPSCPLKPCSQFAHHLFGASPHHSPLFCYAPVPRRRDVLPLHPAECCLSEHCKCEAPQTPLSFPVISRKSYGLFPGSIHSSTVTPGLLVALPPLEHSLLYLAPLCVFPPLYWHGKLQSPTSPNPTCSSASCSE